MDYDLDDFREDMFLKYINFLLLIHPYIFGTKIIDLIALYFNRPKIN